MVATDAQPNAKSFVDFETKKGSLDMHEIICPHCGKATTSTFEQDKS